VGAVASGGRCPGAGRWPGAGGGHVGAAAGCEPWQARGGDRVAGGVQAEGDGQAGAVAKYRRRQEGDGVQAAGGGQAAAVAKWGVVARRGAVAQ